MRTNILGLSQKMVTNVRTKKCTDCVNCDAIRGFMVTCHYSYDTEKDGVKWHVQCGQDVHYSRANKCEYYTEQSYDKDEMFVI